MMSINNQQAKMACIRVAGLITIMIKLFLTLFINFLPVDVKHILTTYSICKESMFLKLSAGSSRISLTRRSLCKKDNLLIKKSSASLLWESTTHGLHEVDTPGRMISAITTTQNGKRLFAVLYWKGVNPTRMSAMKIP